MQLWDDVHGHKFLEEQLASVGQLHGCDLVTVLMPWANSPLHGFVEVTQQATFSAHMNLKLITADHQAL